MDAHVTATQEHAHPTPGVYAKVGFILFVLTALEVALYEITYGTNAGALGDLTSVFVPVLLALSAAKFALVAGFYMHLKQDPRLLAGLFVFPLIIASIIIVSLMVLIAYHHAFAKSG
jgi:cytochrome c oxidase subunit IV